MQSSSGRMNLWLYFVLGVSVFGASGNSYASRAVLQVVAGAQHTCALLVDHTVKCWGDGEYGQNGQNGSTVTAANLATRVDFGTGVQVTQLAAGANHTCALSQDGLVRCFGHNDHGQLGLGDLRDHGTTAADMGDALPPVDLGDGQIATAIAAGGDTTCALLQGGAVKCWGASESGETGQGSEADTGGHFGQMGAKLKPVNLGTGRTATQIAVGGVHVCAILDDKSLRCWGGNDYGQLGLGDNINRGYVAGDMGDNLHAVDLGTGIQAVSIALGQYHSCALLAGTTGAVKCWGLNSSGQLAQSDTLNRGDLPLQMGDALVPASLTTSGVPVIQLAAGQDSTCAVFLNGTMKCWGGNEDGQLGLGDSNPRGNQAGQLGDQLPAVTFSALESVHAAALGAEHVCVVELAGELKCWGNNSNGQLGLGDNSERGGDPGTLPSMIPWVSP